MLNECEERINITTLSIHCCYARLSDIHQLSNVVKLVQIRQTIKIKKCKKCRNANCKMKNETVV